MGRAVGIDATRRTGFFDFVGHGLSEYNLQRWLMGGLVFGFIAFAWLLAVEVNKRV